jgi:hypothetical protein
MQNDDVSMAFLQAARRKQTYLQQVRDLSQEPDTCTAAGDFPELESVKTSSPGPVGPGQPCSSRSLPG